MLPRQEEHRNCMGSRELFVADSVEGAISFCAKVFTAPQVSQILGGNNAFSEQWRHARVYFLIFI